MKTNKEIRVNNKYWQGAVPHQTVVHITPDGIDILIDEIQTETRKDEREKVIDEALKIFDDIPYREVPVLLDQYGGTNIEWHVDIQKLKEKLNSLKQC